MTDSPIFIVGSPRSGTSLLRDMLRSHPHLAFAEESHFIPRLYKAYGDPRTERDARALAKRILSLQWVPSWGVSLDPSSLAHHRSYAELVSAIYEEVAHRAGKSRWGDKTPQYVTEIATLIELFPRAKILNIYRDGRDVALSWLEAGFGPQNVFTAADLWKDLVTTGRRDGEGLAPGSYMEVGYEALVTSPDETMRRVCGFLDEPFTEDVLAPSTPGGSRITRSRVGRWRTDMRPAYRSLFESVAGDLLASLGYETEGLARRVSRPERLAWKADHATRRVVRRLRPTDQNWDLRTLVLMKEAAIRHRVRAAVRGRAV